MRREKWGRYEKEKGMKGKDGEKYKRNEGIGRETRER